MHGLLIYKNIKKLFILLKAIIYLHRRSQQKLTEKITAIKMLKLEVKRRVCAWHRKKSSALSLNSTNGFSTKLSLTRNISY